MSNDGVNFNRFTCYSPKQIVPVSWYFAIVHSCKSLVIEFEFWQIKNASIVLFECSTIKHIVAFVQEYWCEGLFKNKKTAVMVSIILEALTNKQYQTPPETDNTIVVGLGTLNMRQKWSQSLGMRFNQIMLHRITETVKHLLIQRKVE